jgi:hypothetical protein
MRIEDEYNVINFSIFQPPSLVLSSPSISKHTISKLPVDFGSIVAKIRVISALQLPKSFSFLTFPINLHNVPHY